MGFHNTLDENEGGKRRYRLLKEFAHVARRNAVAERDHSVERSLRSRLREIGLDAPSRAAVPLRCHAMSACRRAPRAPVPTDRDVVGRALPRVRIEPIRHRSAGCRCSGSAGERRVAARDPGRRPANNPAPARRCRKGQGDGYKAPLRSASCWSMDRCGASTLALPTPLINSRPNWVAEAAPLRKTLMPIISLQPLASSREMR